MSVVFVDSSILIYAHDSDAGAKRQRAQEALSRLWESGEGRLSVQVLQEFYVNVTKKLATPIARQTAREIVANYGVWVHQATTPDIVIRAIDIAAMSQLQFWDALIVASAEQVEAEHVYSEDLNDGQVIAGVTIVNPLIDR
jgi:predicted nucleic acid-binding protein